MFIELLDNKREKAKLFLKEDKNSLLLKGESSSDDYFEINFPFKVSKIPPKLRTTDDFFEHVLVFRNRYFSEYDVCELRRNDGLGNKRIGFLFKPSIIFEDDAKFIFENDNHLQAAIFRSFISLFSEKSSLPTQEIVSGRTIDFRFEDFFPNDIIVGVFPYEWNASFDEGVITEILMNLYSHGFYLLNKAFDFNFEAPDIEFQKDLLDSCYFQKSSFRRYLDIRIVSNFVKNNAYVNYYFKSIIKENWNEIAKFHQAYGLVEIFKDLVLKHEVLEKVQSNDILNSPITGHSVKESILEISKDAFLVGKLFNKYSEGSRSNTDTVFLEIFYFLETCRDKDELDKLTEFSSVYYFLRNIVVHDIQFLFIETKYPSVHTRKKLARVALYIEYVVAETLLKMKI